jgi:hypothetical protein
LGDKESVKSGAGGGADDEIVTATVAACVRDPETPESVTVALPATAADDAASIIDCAVPGVRVRVAGVAVTPEGSPARVTVTGLEKPLTALAVTLTGHPAAPGTSVSELGDTVSVKSGGGVTEMVAATVAVWVSAPEAPDKVIVAPPAAADEAATMERFCAVPGVKLSVAGCAVTPLGNPEMVTATVPVKPFTGAAFTLIVWPVCPATSAIVAGVEDKEKSG